MGQILAEYPSQSKPGKSYDIVRGKDGVVYCNCWAWKINKTCKHLDQFFSKFTNPMPVAPEPVVQTTAPSTIDTAKDLISAIDVKFWDEEEGSNENNQDTK